MKNSNVFLLGFLMFLFACNKEDMPTPDSGIEIKPEKLFTYSAYSRDTFEGDFRTQFLIYEITYPGKFDGAMFMLYENVGSMKEVPRYFQYDETRDVSFTQLVESSDWLSSDELRCYSPGGKFPTQRLAMGKNYSIYSRASANEWILKTSADSMWAYFDVHGDTTMVKPVNDQRTTFTLKKGKSVMAQDVCQGLFSRQWKPEIIEFLFFPE